MVQEMAGQAATGTLTPEARKAFGPKFGKELEAQQSKEDFRLEQKARSVEESTERKAGEAQIEAKQENLRNIKQKNRNKMKLRKLLQKDKSKINREVERAKDSRSDF